MEHPDENIQPKYKIEDPLEIDPLKDIERPPLFMDTKGRMVQRFTYTHSKILETVKGSKTTRGSSEDESAGADTAPASIEGGNIVNSIQIGEGSDIFLDARVGRICVGTIDAGLPFWCITKNKIIGGVGVGLNEIPLVGDFNFFLTTQAPYGPGDFFIGSETDDEFVWWDKSAATLFIKGNIVATSGDIGGWTIANNELFTVVGGLRTGLRPATLPFYVASTSSTDAGIKASATMFIEADGSITVNGGTITGGIIRTAASGKRVEMTAVTNALEISDINAVRMILEDDSLQFNEPGGTHASTLRVDGSNNFILEAAFIPGTSIRLISGSLGSIFLGDNLDNLVINQAGIKFLSNRYLLGQNDFIPQSNKVKDFGSNTNFWREGYIETIFSTTINTTNLSTTSLFSYQGILQPVIFHGLVLKAGSTGTPFPAGWSVIKIATGLYIVTHGLVAFGYTVQLTVFAGPPDVGLSAKVFFRLPTSFFVETFDTTGTFADADFFFTLNK